MKTRIKATLAATAMLATAFVGVAAVATPEAEAQGSVSCVTYGHIQECCAWNFYSGGTGGHIPYPHWDYDCWINY